MNIEKNYVRVVLVYLVDSEQKKVWLARKKRKACKDEFNGFGGEIEVNEEAKYAAVRELKEETGVDVNSENLQFRGKIEFENVFSMGRRQMVDCYIFVVYSWDGEIKLKGDEAYDLRSFYLDNLPLREMPDGDQLWAQEVLRSGKKIRYGKIVKDWNGPMRAGTIEFERR
jgi:8-oxo-dGTP pyrophosphatase MutT (NUDIX family)